MSSGWKWTIAGEFLSLAANLLIFVFIVVNILSSELEPQYFEWILVICVLFGTLTSATRSVFAQFAYRRYPRLGSIPRGANMFFQIFRIFGTIHLLFAAVLLIASVREVFLIPNNIPSAVIVPLLLIFAFFALHLLLMIQQYRFPSYVRNNEKQRMNRLINELGE
ncbi:MAG: hypothetical protein ACK4E0_14960 [Chitinophagaceae bacterium]